MQNITEFVDKYNKKYPLTFEKLKLKKVILIDKEE